MERPRTIETIDALTVDLDGKPISRDSPESAQVLGMSCGCLMWEITQALPGKNILSAEYTSLRKALDLFIVGAISKANLPYFLKGREAFIRDIEDIHAGKVDPNV